MLNSVDFNMPLLFYFDFTPPYHSLFNSYPYNLLVENWVLPLIVFLYTSILHLRKLFFELFCTAKNKSKLDLP